MKTIKVIYKGSFDEENFTFNETYLAKKAKDGRLIVLCDSGLLIEMSESDFQTAGVPAINPVFSNQCLLV